MFPWATKEVAASIDTFAAATISTPPPVAFISIAFVPVPAESNDKTWAPPPIAFNARSWPLPVTVKLESSVPSIETPVPSIVMLLDASTSRLPVTVILELPPAFKANPPVESMSIPPEEFISKASVPVPVDVKIKDESPPPVTDTVKSLASPPPVVTVMLDDTAPESIEKPPEASICKVDASISTGLSWWLPILMDVAESIVKADDESISSSPVIVTLEFASAFNVIAPLAFTSTKVVFISTSFVAFNSSSSSDTKSNIPFADWCIKVPVSPNSNLESVSICKTPSPWVTVTLPLLKLITEREAKNKSDHIKDDVPKAVPSLAPGVNAFSASIKSKALFTVNLIWLSVVKQILFVESLPTQRLSFNILVIVVCKGFTFIVGVAPSPELFRSCIPSPATKDST